MEELYEQLKELTPNEICWVVRNITYYLVSYWGEDNKGPIYNEGYSSLNVEQATRLQQHIRNHTDLLAQVFDKREFDEDYFEDLLTDNYYSKYKEEKERADKNQKLADRYESLCE